MLWKAYKNYKSAEKLAVLDAIPRDSQIPDTTPPAQLHGRPIKWDRIKRFTRSQGPKRSRRLSGIPLVGEKIQLKLHLSSLGPAVNVNEKILFLTKAYLDWNIATWTPLGFAKRPSRDKVGEGAQGAQDVSRLFNKCFYDAIPLLMTNRTSEAFKEISLACSLASQCLQQSPYWVFLRLLRLYSYPLWGRFPDVRRQIIAFLQALATRTLPNGHPLRPLLQMWAQEEIGEESGRVPSILRLSADTFGPASGLDAEEWAWVQDEICSLSYQRKELHDAQRIARSLTEDPSVPRGVHIMSRQMIARFHLQLGDIDRAEPILIDTLRTCADYETEDERARYLQQTYSDLGYICHVRGEQVRSLHFYQQALDKAMQSEMENGANTNSLRARVDYLTAQYEQGGALNGTRVQENDSSWALWAVCRPYS